MKGEINLFPWRERQREEQKKNFVMISGGAGFLALFLAFIDWSYQAYRLDDQIQANQLISSAQQDLDIELKQIEQINTNDQIQFKQIQFLHHLQGQRPVTTRLMDELVRLLPEDLHLEKVSRNGSGLTLEGKAVHPSTVSTLLRQLEHSIWFQNAVIRSFVMPDELPSSQSADVHHEGRYGRYVVTVDLSNIALDLPHSKSP